MDVWREPPGGLTDQQRRQLRRRRIQAQLVIVSVAISSTAAVAGYRWITRVNPVGRSHAIELFRAERGSAAVVARPATSRAAREQERPRDQAVRPAPAKPAHPRTRSARGADAHMAPIVNAPERGRDSPAPTETRAPQADTAVPEEGVYSWATQGHEQVSGARREFPDETQRIITMSGRGRWTQHHYFSEERQIWTAFQRGSNGVEVTQQRNKVSFGPVSRESKIDFNPPMLAAPGDLRVGFQWGGKWTGDTYGNYSGNVFEHTTMAIGGERVEVWGMDLLIDLRGDQQGRVRAQVWFAPRVGLTVKEHYVQDVDSGGAQYHAEWIQTLKSLQPAQ